MPSERAAELAADFAAANEEALQFAGSCTDVDWKVDVPGEGWTVGVVLHHVAEQHAQFLRWLRSMTSGEGVSESAEDIDRANADHAERATSIGQVETAVLLANNGARIEQALRMLSDEELDRRAPFGPAGGRVLPTGDLAAVVARHTREHLASAKQAVARP
jgi:DinB family protein